MFQTTSAPTLTDLLFEKADAGLCLVGPDGTVVRANAEWLRSTGFTEEQVVGENIIELFPATREMALAMHARARAGRRVEVPRRAQVVNGRETWWEGSIDPVSMEGGTGLLITAREAKHSAASASAERTSAAEVRACIDGVHAGVALIDSSGKFSTVNKQFLALFGLPSEADVLNVYRQDWGAWQVYDDRGGLLPVDEHPVRKAVLTRAPVRDQLVAVRLPSGAELRWMLVSAEPILAADGALQQVVCTCNEITALKLAEERARSLASIIENSNIVFAMAAPDGRLLRFNRAFEELTGYSREEIEARAITYADLTPPEWRQCEADALARAVASRKPVKYEKEYQRRDGSRVPIELVVQPVFAEDGSIDHYWAFLTEIADRKRAEAALRESEARYRLLFQNMLDGVAYCRMIYDERGCPYDFVYLDVNEEFERLTGLRDVVGKRVSDVLPGLREAHPELIATYGRVAREGQPDRFEIDFRPLGAWLSVAVYRPQPDHFVAVFENITERKRAEAALRAREADLARAQRAAHLGSWRWTLATDAVAWSDELFRVFGVDPSTFVPSNAAAHEFIHPDDRAQHAHFVSRALAGEDVPAFESRIVRPGGEQRVVLASGFQVERDSAGRPEALFGTILDITERKLAEQEIRRSEEALEAFFAASPGILNIEDAEFRYVKTDPLTPTYFGLSRETIVGKAVADLSPPFIDKFGPMMRRVIDTGEPALNREVHSTVPGRPGETAYWRASYFPVPLPGGKRGIGIIGVEITDLKRAQDALRAAYDQLHEADRRKDEFLSAASHELRTPLATLRIHADSLSLLMSEGRADEVRVRRKLDSMNAQLDRLQALINALLDVTRISAGRLKLERHSCDLAQLAAEAVERFEDPAERARVKLSLEAARCVGPWDPMRIDQVLSNLIDNALKHAPGSRTDVVVRPDHTEALLVVHDNGPGISPDSQARIFQQYERAAEARVFGGLGLGLWITRQIVEAHGGTISVESAPGEGATFTVRLPMRETR